MTQIIYSLNNDNAMLNKGTKYNVALAVRDLYNLLHKVNSSKFSTI